MIYRHELKAEWIKGKGIQVITPDGRQVRVEYAATTDERTCYAYVRGMGFIGGWQAMPKKFKPHFRQLIDFINFGHLYTDMANLPGRYQKDREVYNVKISPPPEAYVSSDHE